MRVFVAGASGVIGKPLLRQLLEAGHEVAGTTRKQERAAEIEAAGATAVVCDALDQAALTRAVADAAPEVVISQLTSLPKDYNLRKIDYGPTNAARRDGGHNLLESAKAAGSRRYVTQSIAFIYEPEGDWVKGEDAPTLRNPPEKFASGVDATIEHEQEILGADGLDGLVLRYGQFYGPGSYYAPGESIAEMVRKRQFPVIGPGTGVSSFIQIEDAASATVAAVERGAPAIYNVVDDEPAQLREWLPVYAEAIGAKPPRKVPAWVARLAAGKMAPMFGVSLRGASNEKAKRELGWSPRYSSWRQGFKEALA